MEKQEYLGFLSSAVLDAVGSAAVDPCSVTSVGVLEVQRRCCTKHWCSGPLHFQPAVPHAHTRTVSEAQCQCKFACPKRARPYAIPSCISAIPWPEAHKAAPAEVKAGCSHSLQRATGGAAQLQGTPGRGSGGSQGWQGLYMGEDEENMIAHKRFLCTAEGSSAQLQPRHSPSPLTSEHKFFFLSFFSVKALSAKLITLITL